MKTKFVKLFPGLIAVAVINILLFSCANGSGGGGSSGGSNSYVAVFSIQESSVSNCSQSSNVTLHVTNETGVNVCTIRAWNNDLSNGGWETVADNVQITNNQIIVPTSGSLFAASNYRTNSNGSFVTIQVLLTTNDSTYNPTVSLYFN